MRRIDRIREDIIGRVSHSSACWNDDQNDELSAESMLESGRLGRYLWRQTNGRRRQIVKRLFDLTVEDFDKRL
ncbi:MAG: hypothetical protein ACOC2L_00650 [Candidatus Sumerlaeota bacterium]